MSIPAEAPGGEVLVYEASDGQIRVDVRLDHETVWLNQEQMGQLFGRERSVITKHVRNVFREGKLEAGAVCAEFAQVQTEGERTVTRDIDHYNLYVSRPRLARKPRLVRQARPRDRAGRRSVLSVFIKDYRNYGTVTWCSKAAA